MIKKNFEYPNKIQFNQEISLEHLFSYNFTFGTYLVMSKWLEKETPEMQSWTGVTTHSHLEGKLILYIKYKYLRMYMKKVYK